MARYSAIASNLPARIGTFQIEGALTWFADRGVRPPVQAGDWADIHRPIDFVGANYYWVPGTGRGRLKVLRYEKHLQIYQQGQVAIEYPLAPEGVRNQQIDPPHKPASHAHPRHRPQPSHEEEKRLRALAPTVSAYVEFLLATPGLLRHQTLRRLWALSQRMSPDLFVRSVARAHRYRVSPGSHSEIAGM
jgi:hypothetical protein